MSKNNQWIWIIAIVAVVLLVTMGGLRLGVFSTYTTSRNCDNWLSNEQSKNTIDDSVTEPPFCWHKDSNKDRWVTNLVVATLGGCKVIYEQGCGGQCTPRTCTSLGKECGNWNDGCGGSLECGSCEKNEDCESGICVPESGETCTSGDEKCIGHALYECNPDTNEFVFEGYEKGRCGVECNDLVKCPVSQNCVNFECVPAQCTPDCSGLDCGSDGCGGSCGTCLSGEACNQEGLCVDLCIPEGCGSLGKECGIWTDGCGGNLFCGLCDTGSECNVDGVCEELPDCVSNEECPQNTCYDYQCISGQCTATTTIPDKPCDRAAWGDYPICQWDVSGCEEPPETCLFPIGDFCVEMWMLILVIALFVVLIILKK